MISPHRRTGKNYKEKILHLFFSCVRFSESWFLRNGIKVLFSKEIKHNVASENSIFWHSWSKEIHRLTHFWSFLVKVRLHPGLHATITDCYSILAYQNKCSRHSSSSFSSERIWITNYCNCVLFSPMHTPEYEFYLTNRCVKFKVRLHPPPLCRVHLNSKETYCISCLNVLNIGTMSTSHFSSMRCNDLTHLDI